MAQQTAVEWLIEQYKKDGYIGIQREEQAKQMEQIIKAFKHGELPPLFVNAEEYYNETYNK